MSDEQPSVAVYAEPNVIKVSARTAGILLVFTLVFTALMAGMHSATESRLQASAQIQKLRMISEVLPAATYDNDLLQDSITLPATAALSTDSDTTIYRARKGGAPSALVLESVAPDGYSGRIYGHQHHAVLLILMCRGIAESHKNEQTTMRMPNTCAPPLSSVQYYITAIGSNGSLHIGSIAAGHIGFGHTKRGTYVACQ